MTKYRKKPVVIDAWKYAWQFTKENYKKGVPYWIKHSNRKVNLWSQYGGDVIGGEIETLEGNYTVSENDYIIKGMKGEIYPCKPDVFETMYLK